MLRAGPDQEPDRYTLLARHSSGGEGELWRAQLDVDGLVLPVAIKVAHLDVVQSPVPHTPDAAGPPPVPEDAVGASWGSSAGASAQRWRQQAELLRTLDHPGLVRVREVFEGPAPHPPGSVPPAGAPQGGAGNHTNERRLYLAMNWVDGRNGVRWVAEEPDRGLRAVLRVLQQLAATVDHLHLGVDTGGVPVVHRDIKPANLVLDDDRMWLVDFGLARPSRTRTLTVAGTLSYLAPEVLEGETFTPASDRYAIGATAYYLLTGTNPRLHRPDENRSVLEEALGAAAGSELLDLLLVMLDPNPDRRPRQATPWVTALWELTGDAGPVPSLPDGWLTAPVDADASLTVLRAPRSLGAGSGSDTQDTEPRGVDSPTLGGRLWWLLSAAALALAVVVVVWPVTAGLGVSGDQPRSQWQQATLPMATDADGAVPLAATTDAEQVLVVGVDRHATGDRAAVWSASDGGRWQALSPDPATFPTSSALLTVTAIDAGGFVAGGSVVTDGGWQPAIWSSTAGRSWSRRCCGTDEDGASGAVTGIAVGPDGLIAVGRRGERGAVWRSHDGRAWTAVPPEETGLPAGSSLEAVTVTGDDDLLAVGSQDGTAAVWRSSDGDSWAQDAGIPDGTSLYDVTAMDDRPVVVGAAQDRPAAWVEEDAQEWVRAEIPDAGAGHLWGVAAAGDQLVAVGQVTGDAGDVIGVWWSPDGTTWTQGGPRGAETAAVGGAAFAVTASDSDLFVVGGQSPAGASDRAVLWQHPLGP